MRILGTPAKPGDERWFDTLHSPPMIEHGELRLYQRYGTPKVGIPVRPCASMGRLWVSGGGQSPGNQVAQIYGKRAFVGMALIANP